MAGDTLLGLRSASAAAEDYLKIEYGARAGRNAAILMDATSDTAEMRLISLAHAFVFEYFEDASPDRSLQGCLQSFLGLTMETLEGLFGYDEWNGAVDSYIQTCEDIFDGYSEDKNFDPRILALSTDAAPLLDDGIAKKDPKGCVEGHQRRVPDSELQHIYDTVQSVFDMYGRTEADPDPEAVITLLKAIRIADEETSEVNHCEKETRIDLKPPSSPPEGQTPKLIEGCERDGFPVREDASSEGRIPRFTASSGKVTVEFVFGGDPDEDTQDRSRARGQKPPEGWVYFARSPKYT